MRWRVVVIVAPWLAVIVLLWREQSLESAVSGWVAAGQKTIDEAVNNLVKNATDALQDAVTARSAMN